MARRSMWRPRANEFATGWTQPFKDYLEEWADRAEGNRYMHLQASSYYAQFHAIFGLPTAVISSFTTASTFA